MGSSPLVEEKKNDNKHTKELENWCRISPLDIVHGRFR